MNDADFDMLSERLHATDGIDGFDTKLRILAIEYALKMGTDVHASAMKFYQFMKGESN